MALQYSNVTGDVPENVLHVHHVDGSAWTGTQLDTVATTIAGAFPANLQAYYSPSIVLTNIRATDLSTQTGPSHLDTYNVPGTNANEAFPAGVTLALKLTTGLRGRSYRGRIYFVGLCDVRSAEDTLDATYAGNILTGWRAIRTAINAVTNTELVVLSYCNGGSWRATGVATPVTSIDLVDLYVDYQRRRATAHARHR